MADLNDTTMDGPGATGGAIGVRPTLGLIAAEAGVSATTVSLVLNGRAARHRISDQTRDRVVQAAKRLDYVPNDLARALRARKTGAVGVLFPHLRNDWAHEIMEGVSSVLDAEGIVALIVSHGGDPEREQAELTSLMQRRVDGIICNPLADGAERYRRVIRRRVPIVFLSDTVRELADQSYSAWDPTAVEQPIGHLIACGRRKLAYLDFEDDRVITTRRLEVYRALLAREGIAVREDWVIRVPRGEAVGEWVTRVFGRGDRPDGLFSLYDDVAIDAIDALEGIGLSVPGDVAVSATGNSKLAGPRGYGLTRMEAPVREEGAAAARALLRVIREPGCGAVQELVGGGEMRVCRTTGGES